MKIQRGKLKRLGKQIMSWLLCLCMVYSASSNSLAIFAADNAGETPSAAAETGNGKYKTGDILADGLEYEFRGNEKVYSTSDGLHTDKTAAVATSGPESSVNDEDGARTFDLTLEAWNADETKISVGLVLDASGSMVFISDENDLKKIVNPNPTTYKPGTALNATQIGNFLDSTKTDNAPLSYINYTYYVYDPRSNTAEYVPLAYWNGNANSGGDAILSNGTVVNVNTETATTQTGRAGWYYINTSGNVYTWNYTSTKTFRGLTANMNRFPQANLVDGYNNVPGINNFTTSLGPSVFYFGTDGYLHCIFNPNNDGYADSIVYEKQEGGKIKAEDLRDALTSFTARLDKSVEEKNRELSAVRFSSQYFDPEITTNTSGKSIAPNDRHLYELLLLNWTKTMPSGEEILTRSRGNGGVFDYDDEQPHNQYNYVYTGSTYAYTGLAEFREDLAGEETIADSEKFLIVFTDGKDQESSYAATNGKAKTIANDLKKATGYDYTIFSVMLTGGANEFGEDEAKFLGEISSENAAVTDAEESDYVYHAENGESLEDAFSTILDHILPTLKNYTVQDYIDPRFDLVAVVGEGDYNSAAQVIHLNANGKVKYGDTETTLSEVGMKVKLSADDDNVATLCYDTLNKMYYIRWENQRIPGCDVGDVEVEVWSNTIRVKAKDDFIGGNSMLTNGNLGNMNMVYLEADKEKGNASSGKGKYQDEYKEDDDGNPTTGPSKGFPRTEVNVKVIPPDLNDGSGKFYLGESPKDFLQELLDTLDESKAEGKVYVEYLKRFWERYSSSDPEIVQAAIDAFNEANKDNGISLSKGQITSFEKFVDFIANALEPKGPGSKGSVSLPYYYLPDNANAQKNQTGTNFHEEDYIGDITFDWEPVGTDGGGLTATFYPEGTDNRNKDSKLVQDNDYKYKEEDKPIEGDSQGKTEADDEYKPTYVSGGVALKLEIDNSADLKWLLSEDGDWGSAGQTFTVSVKDEDGEEVGQLIIEVKNDNSLVLYSNTLTGLPKGDYTLEFSNAANEYGKHVKVTFEISKNPDDYNSDSTFKNGAYDFIAPNSGETTNKDNVESAEFHLGTVEKDDDGYGYLDERYGVVVIKIEVEDHGILSISKEFADDPETNEHDAELTFYFNVNLYKAQGGEELTGSYPYKVFNKDDSEVENAGGEVGNGGRIPLKAGQYVEIYDLPTGAYYEVSEENQQGFTPTTTSSTSGTIQQDSDGTLRASVGYINTKVYEPISVVLEGTKAWSTNSSEEAPTLDDSYYFTFVVTPTSSDARNSEIAPHDGAEWTVQSGAGGKFTIFNEEEFKAPGTYTYTVKEKVDNPKKPGVEYSEREYTITVKVEEKYENGVYSPGELVAEVTVKLNGEDVDDIEIENEFDYKARLTLEAGTKTLTNGNLSDEEPFEFKLEAVSATNSENVAIPVANIPLPNPAKVKSNGNGTFNFGTIVYDTAGIYHYTLSEINRLDENYVFDTTVYEITVYVVVGEGGVLEASYTIENGTAFEFNNEILDPYNLEITKTVTGTLANVVTEFEFTITLTPPTFTTGELNFPTTYKISGSAAANNGSVGEEGVRNITFTKQNDGTYTATVKLKDEENLVIEGLPDGTEYEVTEEDYSDMGYATSSTGAEGTLGEDDAVAAFENRNPAGGVNLTKTVTSHEEVDKSEDNKFTFTITLTPPNNSNVDLVALAEAGALKYSITGDTAPSILTVVENEGILIALDKDGNPFTLSDGKTLNLSFLPEGTKVVITEIEAVNFTPVYGGNEAAESIEVTIEENTPNQPINVGVNNIRDNGNLEISKTVVPATDGTINADAEFVFEIYFYYTEMDDQNVEKKTYLTGAYPYEIANGSVDSSSVAGTIQSGDTFKLKNNGTIKIKELPAGVTYEVVERNADGYETSVTTSTGKADSNTAKGTIVKGTSVTVAYENTTVDKFEKTSDPVTETTVTLGQEIEYKVTWRNYKNYATTVWVTDELVKGLTYKEGSAAVYIYDEKTEGYVEHTTNVTFDDESMTWTMGNIPAKGRGYVVFTAIVNEEAFEKDDDGYFVENTGNVKVNGDKGIDTNTTVHEVLVGDLEITKTVTASEGETVDPDQEFVFTVRFWTVETDGEGKPVEKALTGSYEYEIVNGSVTSGAVDGMLKSGATFTLKHEGKITIKNLPAGVQYEVEETKVPGYSTTVNNGDPAQSVASNFASGTIVEEATQKAGYVNNKVKAQEKSVTPTTSRYIGEELTYTVTWKNYENSPATVIVRDPLVKGLTYQAGSAKAYIKTLPDDDATKYTYGEYDAELKAYEIIGYSFVANSMTWTLEDMPAGYEGFVVFKAIVNEGAFDEEFYVTEDGKEGYYVKNTATVEVGGDGGISTNTVKNEVLVGDLTISKTVIEDPIDPEKEFTFTVKFSYTDDNDVLQWLKETYKTIVKTGELTTEGEITAKQGFEEAEDGTTTEYYYYEFSLTHGQSITIKDLPANVQFVVTEGKTDGYKTTVNTEESDEYDGDITEDAVVTVEFVNEKADDPVKSAEPEHESDVQIGQKITYQITWENYKNSASNVTITDTLIEALDYQAGTAKAYRYNEETEEYDLVASGIYTGRTLTWALPNQPARSHGYVEFEVIVNEKAGDTVTNIAKVTVNGDSEVETNEVVHYVDKGDLEVSKEVIGDDEDQKDEFNFTVKFSYTDDNDDLQWLQEDYTAYIATTGSTTAEEVTLKAKEQKAEDGTTTEYYYYEFSLKHGQNITIKDLPAGVTYVVTEGKTDGYKTTANGTNSDEFSGVIVANGKGNPAKVAYVNEKVGDPVKSANPEHESDVQIGQKITYQITWENYKNSEANVTITDTLIEALDYQGGTAKAYRYNENTEEYDLVASGIYTGRTLTWVLLNQPARSYGYVEFDVIVNEKAGDTVTNIAKVTVNGDTGIDTNEVVHYVEKGNLSISKKVVDDPIDPDEEFIFTVKFSYLDDNDVLQWLKENYTATIVTEETVEPEEPTEPEESEESEEPEEPEESTEPVELADPEGPTDPEESTDPEEPAEPEVITLEAVEAVDEDGNVYYYYTFTLKHNQTITIEDLPAGVEFVVIEENTDGYKTTANEEESDEYTGVIKSKDEVEAVEVAYVNTRAEKPVKDSDPEEGTMRIVGDEITYTITWENYKNREADVTVLDELIQGLEYKEGSAKAYRYNAETDSYDEIGSGDLVEENTVKWVLEKQPARSYGYVELVAIVTEDAILNEFGNEVINEAAVQVGDDTAVKTNRIKHPISNPTKTEITPGEGKLVLVGSEITYEVTWENYKEEAATVIITDPLDIGVEFVQAKFGALEDEGEWFTGDNKVKEGNIVYDAETHTVIWTLEDQEAKAAGRVTLVVKVKEEANIAGIVDNQASVKVGDDDPVDTNIVENPTPKTGITIHKEQSVGNGKRTDEKLQVQSGDEVTYYITVTNIGDIALNDVIVTDPIPDGLQLVDGSISHKGTVAGGVIAWNLGTLDAHEAITLSFKVKAPNVNEVTSWLNVATESHENPEDPNKPRFENPSNEVEIEEHPSPNTGDSMDYQSWLVMFMVSGLALVALAARRKKLYK